MIGGIESTVMDISEGLTQRGWDVQVLCANNCNKTEITRGRILITRVASLLELASTSISPYLVKFLAKKCRYVDILHLHLPNPMANLAIFFVRPHTKIIVHWHSDIVKQKILLLFYAPLQQWLLRRAEIVICTSLNYAKSSKWLNKHQSKIKIVPSCIKDPIKYKASPLVYKRYQELRATFPEKKIIFSLGRMTYYKGFHILIEAACQLPHDAVILIGGNGDLLDGYKKMIVDLNLSEKIILLGKIPQELLPAYYQAADIFCLPSFIRSEAFGLVLVEAMAYSLPIVSSNIAGSGVPWVNQENITGFNVEPGNSSELAYALNRLLCDGDLAKKFGSAGRKRFESMFELGVMIDSLESIYDQVLKD